MLKQRIITALVLAPLALFAILFLPTEGFKWVIAGVICLGAYEWANMSGLKARVFKVWFTVFIAVICTVIILLVDAESIWSQSELNPIYAFWLWLAVFWWALSLVMIIAYPKFSRFWRDSILIRALFGVLTLIPTWVAVVSLRTSLYEIDSNYGASLLFYVLGIVWAADIGAFFVGVKFGRCIINLAMRAFMFIF